jgi:hypothetical protein
MEGTYIDPMESVMPDFRCDMLDKCGHTLFPAEIVADDLEEAIRHASDILRTSNQSSSPRQVYSFEVWCGTSRLFPGVSTKSEVG